MHDKRMELLTLLSPGLKHGADISLLALDLGVGCREVERLICQLQALGFLVVYERGHVSIDWAGWARVKQVGEEYLSHPDKD